MFVIEKTFKIVLLFTLALFAFPLASRAAGESPSIPGFSLDEIDRRDNEILNLDLSQYNPDSPSAFQDIPPDHWAYKAVQYLAGIGFLEGYDGKQFRGDQVVTRYELAIIVSKMLQNYNKFLRNGYVDRNLPIEKNWPDAEEFPPPQVSYMPEPVIAARTLPQTVRLKRIQEPPPGPMSPAPEAYPTYIPTTSIPSQQTSSRAYSTDELQLLTGPGAPGHSRIYYQPPSLSRGQGTLKQSGPKAFDAPAPVATGTAKTPDKDAAKAKDKAPAKDASKDKGKEKLKIPKEMKKIADKFEVTEKDVEIFEALVKYIKDEMKDSEKDTKKSISEVKRMAKKNEGDIEKLEQNNQRYKVTGGAKFQISSSQTTYTAADTNYSTSVGDSAWYWSSIYSKPRRLEDLVFTYDGSVRINYQDFSSSREHPRNFKLRGLYTGNVGMAYSPLTVFGTSMTGVTTSFLLNKYELQLGLGRKSSSEYLYGAAVKTALFNNPSSFLWITRLMSFQDKDVMNPRTPGTAGADYGCNRADSGWADAFYPVGSWTSGSSICLPPVKDSVSSIFVQTPIPIRNWSIWAEYAHSTYFRQGFGLPMSAQSDANKNYNNQFLITDKYNGSNPWRPIKERRDSDDAFLVLFVYNKGPISIFPLGFVHLGSEFVSRNLGMPGLDTSSLSLDALPINLQSMDLFIIRPTINKSDDRWKDEFMYLTGGEHHPMYLDPSAMASQATLVNSFKIFDKLNNRGFETMLRATVLMNSFTYYVSDKIQLSTSYTGVRVALGPGCIDANDSQIKNDMGQQVDYLIGNGTTNCTAGDPAKDDQDINPTIRYKTKSQSYSLYWKTSKRADMNFSVGKSSNQAKISLGAGDAVDAALKALIPAKQSQSLSASLNYRLTDVSTVSMWYNDGYIAHLSDFYKNSGLNTDRVSAMGDSVGFSLEMSF